MRGPMETVSSTANQGDRMEADGEPREGTWRPSADHTARVSCASCALGILDVTVLQGSFGSNRRLLRHCLQHKTAKRHR